MALPGGLPCVCDTPVEIRSVGVDQQEFDAAGFGVGTAAGGLFGFAHDDAFGRDAFGDEGITNAKGALFGQVAVEGGITSGVVVAGQQDVAAIGGVEGFDDGGDDGCVFSGDVGRCRGEVNDTRDFGGTFDIEGNEVVFVVGTGSGGRGAVSAAGRTASPPWPSWPALGSWPSWALSLPGWACWWPWPAWAPACVRAAGCCEASVSAPPSLSTQMMRETSRMVTVENTTQRPVRVVVSSSFRAMGIPRAGLDGTE